MIGSCCGCLRQLPNVSLRSVTLCVRPEPTALSYVLCYLCRTVALFALVLAGRRRSVTLYSLQLSVIHYHNSPIQTVFKPSQVMQSCRPMNHSRYRGRLLHLASCTPELTSPSTDPPPDLPPQVASESR